MRTAQLDNLTAARFFAALLVIFHHAPNVLQNPAIISQGWLRIFFNNGYVGVTFFFILSGFVISASNFDKLRIASIGGTLTFFARRVFRIVPVWLFLSLPIVLSALTARPIPFSLFQFLTFTQAWSADVSISFGYLAVAWTLSCEMFFYVLFPLTAFVMGRMQDRYRHAGAVLVIVAITIPLCACILFVFHPYLATLNLMDANGPHRWLYRNPAMRFSEFLFGVGLFLCFRQYHSQWKQTCRRWIWLSVLIVSIVILVMLMSHLVMSTMTLTFAYIIPFGLIVFSLAAIEVDALPLSISGTLMVLLGEASYSLYLIHQQYGLPFYLPFFGASTPLLGLSWGILFTIAMSVGLYKLIEQPTRTRLNHYLVRMQALSIRCIGNKSSERRPSQT